MSRFSERGGWWVAGQFALLAMIVASPSRSKASALAPIFHWMGAVLLSFSAGILATGSLKLGKRLTPFPRPSENSSLETTGIYRHVRHPLYLGVILAAFGIASLKMNPWSLLLSAALAALLNAKAEREEAWLSEKFPGYRAYRLISAKFIPFLF